MNTKSVTMSKKLLTLSSKAYKDIAVVSGSYKAGQIAAKEDNVRACGQTPCAKYTTDAIETKDRGGTFNEIV